jgi:hypothetical protein
MIVDMLAVMPVGVAVHGAIGMTMRVLVGGRRCETLVPVRFPVDMGVAVHRPVRMDVGMPVELLAFEARLALFAAACGAHDPLPYSTSSSRTRISMPAVASTW